MKETKDEKKTRLELLESKELHTFIVDISPEIHEMLKALSTHKKWSVKLVSREILTHGVNKLYTKLQDGTLDW